MPVLVGDRRLDELGHLDVQELDLLDLDVVERPHRPLRVGGHAPEHGHLGELLEQVLLARVDLQGRALAEGAADMREHLGLHEAVEVVGADVAVEEAQVLGDRAIADRQGHADVDALEAQHLDREGLLLEPTLVALDVIPGGDGVQPLAPGAVGDDAALEEAKHHPLMTGRDVDEDALPHQADEDQQQRQRRVGVELGPIDALGEPLSAGQRLLELEVRSLIVGVKLGHRPVFAACAALRRGSPR